MWRYLDDLSTHEPITWHFDSYYPSDLLLWQCAPVTFLHLLYVYDPSRFFVPPGSSSMFYHTWHYVHPLVPAQWHDVQPGAVSHIFYHVGVAEDILGCSQSIHVQMTDYFYFCYCVVFILTIVANLSLNCLFYIYPTPRPEKHLWLFL